MNINSKCLECTLRKVIGLYDIYGEGSEKERFLFLKKLYEQSANTEESHTAPEFCKALMDILTKETGVKDFYKQEKEFSNNVMNSCYEELRKQVKKERDPLKKAMQYSISGNFIDFGAMDVVDEEILFETLEKASQIHIEESLFDKLKEELQKATELAYLLDNAGEIYCDKLFLEELKEQFPKLSISIITRGNPTLNDALREDAIFAELDRFGKIFDTGVNIPGNALSRISPEARTIIEESDVILSKGQGNFEALSGCKKNIYYLFLCKCDLFKDKFSMERFDGVFTHESRLKI